MFGRKDRKEREGRAKALEALRLAFEANPGDSHDAMAYGVGVMLAHQSGEISSADTIVALQKVKAAILDANKHNPAMAMIDRLHEAAFASGGDGLDPALAVGVARELVARGVTPEEIGEVRVADIGEGIGAISVNRRKAAPSDGIGEPVGHA